MGILKVNTRWRQHCSLEYEQFYQMMSFIDVRRFLQRWTIRRDNAGFASENLNRSWKWQFMKRWQIRRVNAWSMLLSLCFGLIDRNDILSYRLKHIASVLFRYITMGWIFCLVDWIILLLFWWEWRTWVDLWNAWIFNIVHWRLRVRVLFTTFWKICAL